jgi:cobalamin biosynthesis protein CobD/CbiB
MDVLAIIAALLLEQWRPLGERKAYFSALAAWADWLERSFNAGQARHGAIAWLVAVVLPVCGVIALYAALWWMSPFAGLLVNVAALYLTLGFRQFSHWFTGIQQAIKAGEIDRARELIGAWRGESALHRSREEVVRLAMEEAIAASHRHVFAVIFWFIVLPGPGGAILYRLSVFLAGRWGAFGEFGRVAERALRVLEWPAARLSAAAFAVVGDFEDAVYCWRTQAAAWPDPLSASCWPREPERWASDSACRSARSRALRRGPSSASARRRMRRFSTARWACSGARWCCGCSC